MRNIITDNTLRDIIRKISLNLISLDIDDTNTLFITNNTDNSILINILNLSIDDELLAKAYKFYEQTSPNIKNVTEIESESLIYLVFKLSTESENDSNKPECKIMISNLEELVSLHIFDNIIETPTWNLVVMEDTNIVDKLVSDIPDTIGI